MAEDPTWTARLTAGPLDGATVRLDVAEEDLPDEVVMSFGVGERSSELAWHSYVLDRSRSAFRYLGENRLQDQDQAVDAVATEATASDDVARRFYDLLFECHPGVRGMFGDDIGPQATRLRRCLEGVLDRVDDVDWLATTLGSLGAHHARLGVPESLYDAFVGTMLTVMAQAAGTDWTPELEDGWRHTLEEITDLMLAHD